MTPEEFYALAHRLTSEGKPFAVATVVSSEGSASARAGAKAILHPDGSATFGWLGGGCVDALVARAAQEALADGRPRMVPVDLTDEVTGAGMPCGGRMTVYVEPVIARPQVVILGHGRIAETVCRLARIVGFRVTVNGPGASSAAYPDADETIAEDARFERLAAGPLTYVVVTTQHKADDLAIKAALARGARFICLVASRKRAGIILGWLREDGVPESSLAAVRAPAGLDLGCETPEEIALSIVSEIVATHRGGTGRPLREVKGAVAPESSPPGAARSCAHGS